MIKRIYVFSSRWCYTPVTLSVGDTRPIKKSTLLILRWSLSFSKTTLLILERSISLAESALLSLVLSISFSKPPFCLLFAVYFLSIKFKGSVPPGAVHPFLGNTGIFNYPFKNFTPCSCLFKILRAYSTPRKINRHANNATLIKPHPPIEQLNSVI